MEFPSVDQQKRPREGPVLFGCGSRIYWLRQLVSPALRLRLHYAADGEGGLREALVSPIDILLLDLALPTRDGLSACAEIRRRADRRVPILMLTARDTLDDKLAGFASDAGAA
jgi:DNA-binding response OmpR family regulator